MNRSMQRQESVGVQMIDPEMEHLSYQQKRRPDSNVQERIIEDNRLREASQGVAQSVK